MQRRSLTFLVLILVFSLALTGCGPQSPSGSDVPDPPDTSDSESVPSDPPAQTEASPTETPKPTATAEPTATSTPTDTPAPTLGETYGESVVWLMRAVNRRQEAFGISQTHWGLGGTPDGGRDYPALDALAEADDETLFAKVKEIQKDVYNIVGVGSGHWGFWHNGKDKLHTFETLYNEDSASYWLSAPEDGNLDEIRRVLNGMSTVARGPRGMQTLFREADVNNKTGTLGELNALLADSEVFQAKRQAPLEPDWYHWASQELVITQAGVPYHAQIARAYITFSLEYFEHAPAVEDPVILRVHFVNIRNDKIVLPGFDTEPLLINVSAGYCEPAARQGSGYCDSIQTEEQRQIMWTACGDKAHAEAELFPGGDVEGYYEFELPKEVFTGGGWAQFKLHLEDEYKLDEMELEPPGSWQSFGVSEHDNWLIFTLEFPEIPDMPSSFN